jgi:myosin heavy subunit
MMIAPVTFIDNSSCVELIARSKDSIINTLDSVCRAPGPTEEKFNSLLHQIHSKKENFPKPEPRYKRETFIIKHYAQSVVYTVGTFIPKNMDTVPSELDILLSSGSTYSLKHDIFQQGLSSKEEAATHNFDPAEFHSNRISATFESYGNPMLSTFREREGSVVSTIDEEEAGGEQQHLQHQSLYSNEMKSKLQLFSNAQKAGAGGGATGGGAGARVAPKKTRTDTVGTTFIKQMASLCHHLDSTTCTFIRCVKPNSSMTPGLFEHKFVMDQVRVLGIVQTCEVLKQGLPSRVHYLEIETMYRQHHLFPERARHLTRHLNEVNFTKAVLWSLKIPRSQYELGKTRIFFTASNISAMDLLLRVDMEKDEERAALVSGVVRYVIRNYWRRAILYARIRSEVLKLYRWSQIRCQCAVIVQRGWRKYIGSLRRIRKQQLRSLWRKAIYFTVSCNILLENYLLIREATEMRLRAEAAAEERMRVLQEEERKRSETMEMISQNRRSISEKRRMSSVSLGNALGNLVSRLSMNEENVFRAPTLSCVAELGEGEDGEEGEDDDEEMKIMMKATESARVQSEMRALVAASALATVSVCLFRWTKIKLFQAFEKWHEVSFYSEELATAGNGTGGRTRVLSMLQKTRQGSQRHSRVGGVEEEKEEDTTTATAPCVCFECQDRTAQLWCSSCLQVFYLFSRDSPNISSSSSSSPTSPPLRRLLLSALSSLSCSRTVKSAVSLFTVAVAL